MNAFPDKLRLLDRGIINGTRVFELESDFRFFSSFGLIKVKKGFLTDGFSVPKFLHSYCSPIAKGMESSVIHDWGYSPLNTTFTKAEIDLIFLEGMKICGVGFCKRYTIYNAVRMFGGFVYKGYEE